jgi:hypothetical protein
MQLGKQEADGITIERGLSSAMLGVADEQEDNVSTLPLQLS